VQKATANTDGSADVHYCSSIGVEQLQCLCQQGHADQSTLIAGTWIGEKPPSAAPSCGIIALCVGKQLERMTA
jgi:hypothetical protein